MERRALGNSGLSMAPLMFGGNVFGWTVDEPMAFRLLDTFVGEGFNAIDTADVYSNWKEGNSGGESEAQIGKWLKRSGKRDQVLIATKVGHTMGKDGMGLSREHIFRAVDASLGRLRTDCIDLYQSHVDDPTIPMEETLNAYSELVKQGKVRVIGASNFTRERLSEAIRISAELGLPRYESLQPLYNLYDRAHYEGELEPFCSERHFGVIPYSSLRSGFLTGKYRSEADLSKSARGQGVKKFLNERGFQILAALDHVSEQLDSNPTRVALAWLLARPSITAPIVSATDPKQLADLLAAPFLKLDAVHLKMLNDASA